MNIGEPRAAGLAFPFARKHQDEGVRLLLRPETKPRIMS